MVTALRTRTVRLVASIAVVGTVATGCIAGGGNQSLPAGGLTRELYDLVNADRAAHGLPALGWDGQLAGLAQGWSQHMASTGGLAHRNMQEILNAGFSGAAENVLVGSCGMSAGQIEAAWMSSALHRRNILGGYNLVGIGAVCANGRLWATQNFGRR